MHKRTHSQRQALKVHKYIDKRTAYNTWHKTRFQQAWPCNALLVCKKGDLHTEYVSTGNSLSGTGCSTWKVFLYWPANLLLSALWTTACYLWARRGHKMAQQRPGFCSLREMVKVIDYEKVIFCIQCVCATRRLTLHLCLHSPPPASQPHILYTMYHQLLSRPHRGGKKII